MSKLDNNKLPNYYLSFEDYDFGWESCKVFYIWNTQPFLLWKFPPTKFLWGNNKVTNCCPLSLDCIIYSRPSQTIKSKISQTSWLSPLVSSKMSLRRTKCNSTVWLWCFPLPSLVPAWFWLLIIEELDYFHWAHNFSLKQFW